jgi:eukaryotic-like serine/threonine-protein kinase
MTPERWKKIEEIFQAALDLSPGARTELIRAECGDDDELRQEVEKLIARYEDEEDFLESPVWTDSLILGNTLRKNVAESLDEAILPAPEEKTFAGRRIGVYLLTGQIGRGGMGVVYAAERADGEFSQKVAVKLIKRGMDTDFIVRRFRHERQILASLNHPNIARLLDGGTTADGAPYFIMEFIEGAPFFKYCEANELDLRARLRLFLAVCDAIAYAHRKKIIHRDLKPGNILISEGGVPKLLDFGIAKILDPDLIHESFAPTATQMRLMTPEFASPEQVRGDEITPASDQYSLGVLLYELVTGTRPYKFPSRLPHEIARVICEEIPTNPTAVEVRSNAPQPRENLLANDDFGQKLDRIILKALRKNPSERYSSVEELAADIERLLRNQPIRAEAFEPENIAAETKKISIAVLPFKNLNAAPGDETGGGNFLGIGLADALITRLSNIEQILVRPTSSVLRFGADDVDSREAGLELGVGFVLEGNILYIEKRIRVSVQLFDVASRVTIWAERFDEDFTDFLHLEDKISAKVAESVVPQLTGEDRKKLSKRGTENVAAYEAYLRGRFFWNNFTEDGFARAFDAFQKAIALDGNYALAFAGIADYYIWLGVYGVLPPQESYAAAKRAAKRAIEIDDELAEAYAALGFAALCGDYDWIAAKENTRRAIELNPNYPVARLWHSYILQSAGEFEEGIAQAARAVELDPFTYTNRHVLAWAHYFARRFDEAVKQSDRNIKNFPSIGLGYFTGSWFLRYLGDHEEALRISQKAVELSGNSLFVMLGHGQALAAAGQRRETEEILEKIFEQGRRQYLSFYQVALIYAYAGENERALGALERAFEDREGWLIWLRTEPALDKLRDAPRFIELRKKVERKMTRTKFEEPGALPENNQNPSAAEPQPEPAKRSFFARFWYVFLIAAFVLFFALTRFVSNTTRDDPPPPDAPSAPKTGV